MESGIFASALAIAGCAGGVRTRPIAFSDLSGWDVADHEAAMAAFRATMLLARPGGGTTAADWAALSPFAEDRRPAKRVFESAFRPVLIDDGGRPLFTGYFEPELDGARRPHGPYRHPIHARPADLSDAPYHDAAAIRRGALEGRGLELLWLADPVEAFFLHIQGSGRIRLAEGGVARVGFAGKNNRPYVAIGRLLVERGELALEQADAETIKAWLRRDEAAGSALMDE
ncbi:MAG: MltA domain-containing protein, partial [Pseudomonadota bacterium]